MAFPAAIPVDRATRSGERESSRRLALSFVSCLGRVARMVFSSITFLFYFLPIFLALYFVAGRARNHVLFISSLIFYAWGEPFNVLLLLFSIGFNYVTGLELAKRSGTDRIAWLAAGIAVNLLLLGTFKYAAFLASNANLLLGPLHVSLPVPRLDLPIGISFFTFQAISYLVDVHRKDVAPERNFVLLAVYISMFPHLVAGPIVRFKTIVQDLHERQLSVSRFNLGMSYIVVGLAQKALIADTLAVTADAVFALPTAELTTATAWLGIVTYTLQIYFDFAGYSNIAIGLALMIGIRFPQNFNYPYAAASVTDFWRRWHMSLSQWFRDYLYIPLGGSRRTEARTYLNLAVVFLLVGLWHGASFTFVAWGAYHGSLLVIERIGFRSVLERSWAPIRRAYTLLAVMGGWVLFRSTDFEQAAGYLLALSGFARGDPQVTTVPQYLPGDVRLALVVGIAGSLPVVPWAKARIDALQALCPALPALSRAGAVLAGAALLLLSTGMLASSAYNPFIYFRF
jgi:alginate O-acetyltransferase complex protein AlgI